MAALGARQLQIDIEIGVREMNSSNFNRCVLAVSALASVLTGCNSVGPQIAPLGSVQRHAAPFNIEKIQSTAVASVAHGAPRVSPDRIVYTPANVQILNSTYSLDLNNDRTTDFIISESNTKSACGGHTAYDGTLSLTGQGSNGVEVSDYYAARLFSGALIGPSQSFPTGSWKMEYAFDSWINCLHEIKENIGNWPPGSSGYLGLAFVIRGKTHYGWAAITVTAPRFGWLYATLTGYAYQTIAGKSINAGQM